MDPVELIHQNVGGITLEEYVGQGSFSWVYRGTSSGGGSMAVKILTPGLSGDEQFEVRFRHEAETARRLDHPHIVKIHDIGFERGLTFLIMDFYPGSLNRLIDQGQPIREDTLVLVTDEIAAALSCAHGAGVIHRDIKPDNILMSDTGSWVLADFGIARAVGAFASATGKNMTIGTPHYLSPEQAQGRPLDGRSDLYSLGVTLYRAATGTLPFKAPDWYELARMHVEDPPIPPRQLRPDLSTPFEGLVLRLLAKHPADRFDTADTVRREVARLRALQTEDSS